MSLPRTLRGAVLTGPHAIETRELPLSPPGAGEIVLAVGAATTCGTDVKVYLRGGHPRMLTVPTLFGHEVAGTVAAVGAGVVTVREGDRLVVANSASCGQCRACRRGRENLCASLQYLNGAFADYLRVPERFVRRSLHPLPRGVSFERGALAEPLACVLHGIAACETPTRLLEPGDVTLVLGGGPIGLLFVAVLARQGHTVVLADPNATRRETGTLMGASATVAMARDATDAERLTAATPGGTGAEIAVDCTGSPDVWRHAIASVRTGALVNLFGGCAPGSGIELDTHRLHYGELTLKGVYHHRPACFRQALEMLAEPTFPADHLLQGRFGVEGVESALQAMIERRALKLVIATESSAC